MIIFDSGNMAVHRQRDAYVIMLRSRRLAVLTREQLSILRDSLADELNGASPRLGPSETKS
jgi:hypothetical protein